MTAGNRRSNGWLAVGLGVWILAALAGFLTLARYQFTPGPLAVAPARLAQHAVEPRLLVFLHPECPCSESTLSELEKVQAATGSRLHPQLFVYAPHDQPLSWAKGNLYRHALRVPGASTELDPDGRSALKFGVETSGQVLLYSAEGKLVFSGGITDSRNHEGDNDGEDAIVSYLKTGKCPIATAPVFGCALGLKRTG